MLLSERQDVRDVRGEEGVDKVAGDLKILNKGLAFTCLQAQPRTSTKIIKFKSLKIYKYLGTFHPLASKFKRFERDKRCNATTFSVTDVDINSYREQTC